MLIASDSPKTQPPLGMGVREPVPGATWITSTAAQVPYRKWAEATSPDAATCKEPRERGLLLPLGKPVLLKGPVAQEQSSQRLPFRINWFISETETNLLQLTSFFFVKSSHSELIISPKCYL